MNLLFNYLKRIHFVYCLPLILILLTALVNCGKPTLDQQICTLLETRNQYLAVLSGIRDVPSAQEALPTLGVLRSKFRDIIREIYEIATRMSLSSKEIDDAFQRHHTQFLKVNYLLEREFNRIRKERNVLHIIDEQIDLIEMNMSVMGDQLGEKGQGAKANTHKILRKIAEAQKCYYANAKRRYGKFPTLVDCELLDERFNSELPVIDCFHYEMRFNNGQFRCVAFGEGRYSAAALSIDDRMVVCEDSGGCAPSRWSY